LLPDYSAFCREKLLNHWIFGLCLKKEIKNIIAKIDRLVELTGNAAKKLANEIKADIKKLADKT
jgi:hypothetical protein